MSKKILAHNLNSHIVIRFTKSIRVPQKMNPSHSGHFPHNLQEAITPNTYKHLYNLINRLLTDILKTFMLLRGYTVLLFILSITFVLCVLIKSYCQRQLINMSANVSANNRVRGAWEFIKRPYCRLLPSFMFEVNGLHFIRGYLTQCRWILRHLFTSGKADLI